MADEEHNPNEPKNDQAGLEPVQDPLVPFFPGASQSDLQGKPSDDQQPQEGQQEEESESEENVCAGLLEDDTFHGMIPMEDLNKYLKANGNYLLRSADANKDGRKIILSVFWNGQVKDIQICGAPGQGVTLDMTNTKPTILELIEFHRTEKVPISPEGILLGKGIKRHSWELRRDAITQKEKLGEGAFGEVYRGTLKFRTTGRVVKVAIKIPKTKDLSKDLVGEAMKEARIQKDYKHPNIVRLYGVSAEIDPLMIVFEYVAGGSLDAYVKKFKDELTPNHKAMMCFDVCCGLEYLHSQDCIHRDIAARNCLMDIASQVVKISDFGLSSVGTVHHMDKTKPAPIRWLAPDVLKTATYVKASDIWSLGIVFWEIHTNCAEAPFKAYSTGELQAKLCTETEFHPEMPLTTLQDVKNLALKCWNMDPEKRPTAAQCVDELANHKNAQRYAKITELALELAQTKRGQLAKNKKKRSKRRKAVSSQLSATTTTSMNPKTVGTAPICPVKRNPPPPKSVLKSTISKGGVVSKVPGKSGSASSVSKKNKSVKSKSSLERPNLPVNHPSKNLKLNPNSNKSKKN